MERAATGVRDIHGDMIYTDDILKIKGEYTGEIFKQHGRWLVAVETLRFMFPVTILPLTELPLRVEIIADVGIPASKSKKFKEQALNGLQLPIKKPDVDNVAKIILDSISGIVYKDDKQIVKLTVSKKYSDTPKVEVKIYNVE